LALAIQFFWVVDGPYAEGRPATVLRAGGDGVLLASLMSTDESIEGEFVVICDDVHDSRYA
jgi:hypothetical protein